MNYPTTQQSMTTGTRCQLTPSVSEMKQGSGAAQRLRGQSSSPASPPAKTSGPTCSTEQRASNDLGGGSEGVAKQAHRWPWRHGGAALQYAGHHRPDASAEMTGC